MKKIEKKLSFDKKTITELKNDELKNFYGGEKGSRNCPVKPATMGTRDCIATAAGCEPGITQVQSCCQPNINCESAASVTCQN